jgi:hypothetical protein
MGPDDIDQEQIDAGVEEIAGSLGLGQSEDEHVEVVTDPETPITPATQVATVRNPPKSWAKEYHESWSKIDPKVQEYVELREKQMLDGIEQYKDHSGFGKTMRDVITPYKALIAAQGIDEAKAVGVLMNAHYKMSTLGAQDRAAYFSMLAKNYGVDLSQLPQGQQEQVNPALQKVEQRLGSIETALTQREQAALEATRHQVTKDVGSFADAKDEKGNPLRPYFDEVSEDIVTFINAGLTLQESYEKAVYANPVTRAKELARLKTEAEANLRTKSKQEADQARRASSTNVRSRDTNRAPTEPLGKMDDTLKDTLATIRGRAH